MLTEISKKVPLQEVLLGLDYYRRHMSEGKVLVSPWMEESSGLYEPLEEQK